MKDPDTVEINFSRLFKKHWVTVIGIWIICMVVIIDIATVHTQKVKVVEECNQHWKKKALEMCPAIVKEGFIFGENLEQLGLNVTLNLTGS